jgi:DNA-binding NarL/FixJ family response regulator
MSHKIVIIEDDPLVRKLIHTILTDEDRYEIYVADDGDIGTDLAIKENPDLVITDIVMPHKDGISTIRDLRDKIPSLKIIAISGGGFNTPQYYLKIAKFCGADTIIRKPVDNDELLQAVQELLPN